MSEKTTSLEKATELFSELKEIHRDDEMVSKEETVLLIFDELLGFIGDDDTPFSFEQIKIYQAIYYRDKRDFIRFEEILNSIPKRNAIFSENEWVYAYYLLLMGVSYSMNGDYQLCIDSLDLIITTENSNVLLGRDIFLLNNHLGKAYFELGYYNRAMEYCYKQKATLMKYYDASNVSGSLAFIYLNIIISYLRLNRIEDASEKYEEFDILIKDDSRIDIQLCRYLAIMEINIARKEFRKCIENGRLALKSAEALNVLQPVLNVNVKLCTAYIHNNDFDEASALAVHTHKLSVENRLKAFEITSLLSISEILLKCGNEVPGKLKNYEILTEKYNLSPEKLLHDIEKLVNKNELSNTKVRVNELLLQYYSSIKQYDRAFHYSTIARKIEKELFDNQKNDLAFKLETEFIKEQQERELAHKDDLLKEQKEISDRLESFASSVSHDMKEPLRAINSFAFLLQRKMKDTLDEQSNEFLNFILDSSKRMNFQIDSLLEYAKIGYNLSEASEVKIDDVLVLVLKNLENEIEESEAEISVTDLPSVSGHFQMITSIFENLISNALKFRKEEKPVISIQYEKHDEKFWQFSITDNGIGMPPNMLDAIFNTFKRLHSYKVYKGTGIGLAICKKTVELYGGKIWVESSENVGTTIYFTLPKFKNSPEGLVASK